MSRSLRKTPIFGIAAARSEADDKRMWHKRWRARERDQLATVGVETDHVTVHQNQVSNTWDMAKDGKGWFSLAQQRDIAKRIATRRAMLKPERKSLQARLLAKWRSK